MARDVAFGRGVPPRPQSTSSSARPASAPKARPSPSGAHSGVMVIQQERAAAIAAKQLQQTGKGAGATGKSTWSKPAKEKLKDELGKRLNEMQAIFQQFDSDGNQQIDKAEFQRAVAALGLDYEVAVVDSVFDGYDADGSGAFDYNEFIRYSLRDSLKRSAARVMTLFRQWDRDGSGSVDKKEFRKAIKELGFDVPVAAVDELFGEMDTDRGGEVEFSELNKILRQGANVTLAKDLQVGAKGKIETESKNAAGLRGSSAKTLPTTRAAPASRSPPKSPPSKPVDTSNAEKLKDALGKRLNEMLDLFKKWDTDGNGSIDKSEFRKAVAALGLQSEDAVVDEVFDCYDADGSGEMAYTEFVQYSLRDSLKRSAGRVMTLFKQWDRDGSGTVDKKEFRKAIKELGFDAPKDALDAVFDSMDGDGGGEVDFKELNKVLRQGASITLAKDLQVGAKGKIETESKNAHGLRGSSAKSLPVKDAAEPSAAAKSPPSTASKLPPQTPGVDGLKDALGKRLREMLDLFKKWDVDLNGTIDKAEFRKAVNALGLEYEAGIVDTVFEGYDADGSGEMEYHEFVQYSLRDSLKRSAGRVMTLFRQWDRDGSGTVDRKEFRKAISELGFDAPKDAIDSVFDSMDSDHGGEVDFKELNKVLRQGASVTLAKELQVGAAGKIETEAKTKTGLRGSSAKSLPVPAATAAAPVQAAAPAPPPQS